LGSTKVFKPVVDDLEELLVSAKTESDTLSILQNVFVGCTRWYSSSRQVVGALGI
jgi:hypothetical protein